VTLDPSILLLVALVGLLLLMNLSRRRQQREQQNLQAQLATGTEVMTASGLIATVVSLEDTVVVLETAPGQRSRWDRRAVAKVLGPGSPAPGDVEDGTLRERLSSAETDDAGAHHDTGRGDAGPGNGTGDDGDTGRGKQS
jgi:preprotein translocase subunit YajC